MYKIYFKKSAAKELASVPKSHYSNIKKHIESLSANPRPDGCKKLIGADEELYRIRVADYRVVYEICDSIQIIDIIRIKHRKDVYR